MQAVAAAAVLSAPQAAVQARSTTNLKSPVTNLQLCIVIFFVL
jgi:hypothetical protein